MVFPWKKGIQNAIDRNQVANKFTWGNYARTCLRQFCNVIQMPKNFTLLTIDMMWTCFLKVLNIKKSYALFIGGAKNVYPSTTNGYIPPAGKFSSFLPIQKTKSGYKHSYQRNSKILPRSIRKISTTPLKKNVYFFFRFQPNRPVFTIRKRLIREYFIMLKYQIKGSISTQQ